MGSNPTSRATYSAGVTVAQEPPKLLDWVRFLGGLPFSDFISRYMETWTSDQVKMILRGTLSRLLKEDNGFKIKNEGTSASITRSLGSSDSIYVSIDKDSYRLFISLDELKGMYTPSVFPWKDKEIKAYIKRLLEVVAGVTPPAMQIILKCFPDAIDQEFEKQVLEPKK